MYTWLFSRDSFYTHTCNLFRLGILRRIIYLDMRFYSEAENYRRREKR